VTQLKQEFFDGKMSFQAALFAEEIAKKSNLKLAQGYRILEEDSGHTHIFNPDARFVIEDNSISIKDGNCSYSIVGCTTSEDGKVYARKKDIKETLDRYSFFKNEKIKLS
jgi:hypothetical protein